LKLFSISIKFAVHFSSHHHLFRDSRRCRIMDTDKKVEELERKMKTLEKRLAEVERKVKKVESHVKKGN
jgi:peptidoglycan hydrolase CwlO-like protein